MLKRLSSEPPAVKKFEDLLLEESRELQSKHLALHPYICEYEKLADTQRRLLSSQEMGKYVHDLEEYHKSYSEWVKLSHNLPIPELLPPRPAGPRIQVPHLPIPNPPRPPEASIELMLKHEEFSRVSNTLSSMSKDPAMLLALKKINEIRTRLSAIYKELDSIKNPNPQILPSATPPPNSPRTPRSPERPASVILHSPEKLTAITKAAAMSFPAPTAIF